MAFGPTDCLALLKAAGILRTRFAQTAQNPFRQLFRCSANANGVWKEGKCKSRIFSWKSRKMMGVIVWVALSAISAIAGFWRDRYLSGIIGFILAGGIPWFVLFAYLLINEYVVPYQGGGASMWPVDQLFAGTIAAVTGVITYSLCKQKTKRHSVR